LRDSVKFLQKFTDICIYKQEWEELIMKDGLYHKDIFLPVKKRETGTVKLTYTKHALEAASDDRYGVIEDLPVVLEFSKVDLIELEVSNGKPVKGVFRQPMDQDNDLVIVVLFNNNLVKTVWLNQRTDKHFTLDKSKYVSRNS
jgi:hypothetical protein